MKYIISLVILILTTYIVINFDTLKKPNSKITNGAAKLVKDNSKNEFEERGFPANVGGGILSGSENPYTPKEQKTIKRRYWQ